MMALLVFLPTLTFVVETFTGISLYRYIKTSSSPSILLPQVRKQKQENKKLPAQNKKVKPWSQDWLMAARAYPGFFSMKRLEVFLLSLDGMLVHHRSLPHNLLGFPQQFTGTHLHLGGESRGFIKFLCRRSMGFFSRAFLVFHMKESKKRRQKQPGKLMNLLREAL